VQCIRAINGTTDNVTSDAGRPRPNFAALAANHKTGVLGALLVGWLMVM
jgi:hypothetical protein